MHLKICSIPITIICDTIHHSISTAHRSGVRKEGPLLPCLLVLMGGAGQPLQLAWVQSQIKQIAVAFATWKRVELLWAGFLTFQKRRILASPIRGFAHTTCAAKCGLGAIEFGDATDLPLHPLPSEIAPCDKVDATDPTAFSTPLGEIHVGAWSILLLAWVRLPFWAHPHVVAMDCGVRECVRV